MLVIELTALFFGLQGSVVVSLAGFIDHASDDFLDRDGELQVIDHVDLIVDIKACHHLLKQLNVLVNPPLDILQVADEVLVVRLLVFLESFAVALVVEIEVLDKVELLLSVCNTCLFQHLEEHVLIFDFV